MRLLTGGSCRRAGRRWMAALVAGVGCVTASIGAAPPLGGQEVAAAGSVLTLVEALELARRHNPGYRSQRNDESVAEWNLREAYGQLLLPGANATLGATYEGAGTQTFGALVSAGSTDFYRSSYSYGLSYSLSPSSFTGVSSARADRRAAGARTDAAAFSLESVVTRQYLAALRARDEVRVSERALERAEQTFLLASIRVQAGAAAPTDGKQAEVDRGRAEVSVLQSRNLLVAEKLRLVEQLGVIPQGDFELEDAFEVVEPRGDVDEFIGRSLGGHPQLQALRASERARDAGVWSARSQYLPSLTVTAGWSGFTRQVGDEGFLLEQESNAAQARFESCQQMNLISSGLGTPLPGFPRNCGGFPLTADDEARILFANRVFPGEFTRQPFILQARVNIPIFTGFTQQRQVGQARAAAEDAREARRAEELRLRTAVTAAHGDLETQFRIVGIEERNVEVAREQVELARERYRLGAAPFLELMEAESSLVTAERGYLNAVYGYLQARAALEEAVGARVN